MTYTAVRFSLCLFVATWLVGCGDSGSKPVTVKGSDTMVILGQEWAENYMNKFPNETVEVNGGGSGTGFAALINGLTEICQASRPVKKKEIERLTAKYGQAPIEITVAKDGIAIYVHEQNPVQSLTLEQIRDIYTGKYSSWKALGGTDEKIILYGRENNSGTYQFFKDVVLKGKDFAPDVQTLIGTAAIPNAVSQDIKSIGYGGIAYSRGVKLVPVRKDSLSAAYPADEVSVATGNYPLARALYFYLGKAPKPQTQAFIDWILSDEGQKIVASVGYFPVKIQVDSSRATADSAKISYNFLTR